MSKEPPTDRRWLLKPLHGAAGAGITFWSPREAAVAVRQKVYCQEYIEGEACSAVYVANGQEARLASATRQLVGEAWLHAGPFQYCASIGPWPLSSGVRSTLEKIGNVLTRACRLRGLFGIDFIIHGDKPYPVEINPRYPASVEILEYATGWRAIADHARVFDATAGEPTPPFSTARCAGKAILFARDALVFPEDGPWLPMLRHSASVHELPLFADIPHAGERIERGRPILTMFASAASVSACIDSLRMMPRDLDRWFFGD
jgi:predicted ATP-grasp superfamily ATP-dependent carboligase